MKGYISKVFKNKPVETVLGLIFFPIVTAFIVLSVLWFILIVTLCFILGIMIALCKMVSNLSIEAGLKWFKEAWI